MVKTKSEEIKMSEEIYNRMFAIRKVVQRNEYSEYPHCFMLGVTNRTHVIRGMIELRGNSEAHNCENMIGIDNKEMMNGMLSLIKKNLIAMGIARIGIFEINEINERGNSLYELTKIFPKAYIISLGDVGHMRAEKYNGKVIKIKLSIVKNVGSEFVMIKKSKFKDNYMKDYDICPAIDCKNCGARECVFSSCYEED